MDTFSFTDFVDQAVGLIASLGDEAADMDGRAAFLLGMVTWFLVEQAIRRLAGLLRWAIIAAALAGSGVAVISLLNIIAEEDPESAMEIQSNVGGLPPAR